MPKDTILIVDDEKDILNLLKYNLEKEGYNVLLAETGEKGLELAKSKRPDLILLDLMLPLMDGLEVCRLLKTSFETQSIPILILTAKSSEVDQVVGLEMGAEDYLVKPFSVKILIARMKNILKKKYSTGIEQAQSVIKVGDFSLDPDRVSFSIKSKKISLTKIEFKILGFLMQYPGIVISKERLVVNVWGEGSFVSSTAINMHLTSLRKKLGKHREQIETVRGSGYRFLETEEKVNL